MKFKKKKAKVDPTFSILFICIQKLQNNWHLVSLAAEFINVTYFNFEKLNFQILIDLLENRSNFCWNLDQYVTYVII